jgi:hypothetical protein
MDNHFLLQIQDGEINQPEVSRLRIDEDSIGGGLQKCRGINRNDLFQNNERSNQAQITDLGQVGIGREVHKMQDVAAGEASLR